MIGLPRTAILPAMIILLAGLTLWAAVHWFPAALPDQRNALVAKLGEGPYKGLFSLLIVLSIVLIIAGWRAAPIVQAYLPPMFGNLFIALAVYLAFVLFFAARIPNNLRRIVRHPQLTGVVLWAGAHLLVNGQVRDLLLFGGMGIWAIVGMLLANRRDGAWQRPAPVPIWQDIILAAVALVVTALLFHFHGTLFGMSAIHLD